MAKQRIIGDRTALRLMYLVHSLEVGGTERLILDLVQQYRAEAVVSVCCLDRPGPWGEALRHRGIPVHCLKRQPGIDLGVVWRLGRLLRWERVSLLHCHQYTSFFYGALASLFSPATRVLFTEHGRAYPDIVSLKRRLANRVLVRLADGMTCVSNAVKQALVTLEGLPAERIEIIYNGVDTQRYAVFTLSRQALHAELGIAGEDLIVGTVGRLDPVKDHPMLLRAFARVHARIPRTHLVIVGDGAMRDTLEQLARALRIEHAVSFLGFRSDVPRLLGLYDVFALSSHNEGMPVTILEAMSAAVPVVATAVGDNPYVVVDGITGIICPPEDAASFADALTSLLEDPSKRQRMGNAGRQRVLREFTAERMAHNYWQVYEMLTRRGRACAVSLAS